MLCDIPVGIVGECEWSTNFLHSIIDTDRDRTELSFELSTRVPARVSVYSKEAGVDWLQGILGIVLSISAGVPLGNPGERSGAIRAPRHHVA